MSLAGCGYKFACSQRYALKLPSKVGANLSLWEMLHHSLLHGAGVLHCQAVIKKLGILSVRASRDYPKIDLVKNPPSHDLLYAPTSIMFNVHLASTNA
jgi:hypothetical protein